MTKLHRTCPECDTRGPATNRCAECGFNFRRATRERPEQDHTSVEGMSRVGTGGGVALILLGVVVGALCMMSIASGTGRFSSLMGLFGAATFVAGGARAIVRAKDTPEPTTGRRFRR